MSPSTLVRLVAPLPIEGFFAEQWSRRAIHLRGEGDRFSDLRPEGGFESWLARADPIDAAHRDAAGGQVQDRIVPAQAAERFAAGHTLCADVSHVPVVAELLAGMREDLRPFRGDPFAKLYVSPRGAGFAPHIDGHHVFVVQLSGRKRWLHGATPARPGSLVGAKVDREGHAVHTWPRDGLPLMGVDGRPLPAPQPGELDEVELRPGDVLYLPPGTWHATEALDTSIALSVSPPRATIAELFAMVVRDELEADPRLWTDIVAPATADGRGPPRAVERAVRFGLGRLRDAIGHLHAVDVHLRWAREAFAGAPATPGSTPAALAPSDRLVHAPGGFVWLRGRDPVEAKTEVLFVFRPGIELVLPVHAERFVKRLHASPELTVADAFAFEPAWPQPDVTDLLADLVEAGVLRRA